MLIKTALAFIRIVAIDVLMRIWFVTGYASVAEEVAACNIAIRTI